MAGKKNVPRIKRFGVLMDIKYLPLVRELAEYTHRSVPKYVEKLIVDAYNKEKGQVECENN